MKWSIALASAVSAAAMLSGAAQADPLPTYPTGVGPGVWNVDRYAPDGFSNVGTQFGRNDVLGLDISSSDGQSNRPAGFQSAFYNTQGYQFRLDLASPMSLKGSLYIPQAWATTSANDATLNRRSDLWGRVTTPDNSEGNADYFIIGFTNADGPARYQVWDDEIGTGWQDLATAVIYDDWTDFEIRWDGSSYDYLINNSLVYTDNTPGSGTVFTTAFVEAYNFGSDYTANWSQIGTTSVPEPASLLLLAGGFVALGGVRRRRL